MWQCGFVLLWLSASLPVISLWLQEGKARWMDMTAAGVAAAASSALLAALGHTAWAAPVGLTAGFLAYGAVGVLRRINGTLAAMCTGLASVAAWLPLYLADESVWQYGCLAAALVACLLTALAARRPWEKGRFVLSDPYRTDTGRYHFWVFLPLGLVPVAGAAAPLMAYASPGQALLLCAALLAVLAVLVVLEELTRQYQTARLLNSAFDQWQTESRDYMNTIRAQRHDFNLHLHAISGLVNTGEYEDCRAYVQRLVADAAAVNDIMPVSDAVVGSMLYNMREQARRKGSDITYEITYDMADTLCNGFACNKIIGNLLQNAIDALDTPQDKACGIHVRIFKRRGNTVVTVENRFTGDKTAIARVFEPGYSTKANHEGIGLSMVLRTVRHYGGRIYPEFEDDRLRFVVNIPNGGEPAGEEGLI